MDDHDLVAWSGTLSVGVQEIDEQHKELVGLLNELHRAVVEHHGSAACADILRRLAEYTRIHFAVEESLMRILAYPEFERHKGEHDALIAQVKQLQAKLAEGKATITFELLHFLKVWLTRHIQASDRRYGAYFLERGISGDWSPHVEETMKKKWSWKFW
jgi:hemerythrin